MRACARGGAALVALVVFWFGMITGLGAAVIGDWHAARLFVLAALLSLAVGLGLAFQAVRRGVPR